MNFFEQIASLSPLPIVDLDEPALPRDGLTYVLTKACHKNYTKGDACRKHYENLSKTQASLTQGQVMQCPFGFASTAIQRHEMRVALTGFVPFPRIGGDKERRAAKYPDTPRIAGEKLSVIVDRLINAVGSLRGLIQEAWSRAKEAEEIAVRKTSEAELVAWKNASMALHEIRKLNRSVKQTAERLCTKESRQNPHEASPELVRIWKSAELMSKEFDVIEFLASPHQSVLPLRSSSQLYKIFDKLVRIYNIQAPGGRRILLRSERYYSPKILANDKTLHIIPSVLIENALKYSRPSSEIHICESVVEKTDKQIG